MAQAGACERTERVTVGERFTFFLGTHRATWLWRYTVPLFVSYRVLAERQSAYPPAMARYAIDSGGFSELKDFGEWRTSPQRYVADLRRWSGELGAPEWAAIQDWMCEPFMLAKTGLSLREHQARSVRSYLELREMAPEIPWAPVLQGYSAGDYLRCRDLYDSAGVDLSAAPVVGVGSVCRRQDTSDAPYIFARLSDGGLRLHGFGVKIGGLARSVRYLASADSMAWSAWARRERGRRLCGGDPSHPHSTGCTNCAGWAFQWRRTVIDAIARGQRHSRTPSHQIEMAL